MRTFTEGAAARYDRLTGDDPFNDPTDIGVDDY